MGISIKNWLLNKLANGESTEVMCLDLASAWQDFKLRELAFNTCVSLIANAMGKVEFKTYRAGAEIREKEYYLWNVEPNINQNSTAFLHKLIYKLYTDNEALVIDVKKRGSEDEMLLVADSFTVEEYAEKPNVYSEVEVDGLSYKKTFKEQDVLHFKLNDKDIKPYLDAMNGSLSELYAAAQNYYKRSKNPRLKVHVGQIAQGQEDFTEKFAQMIEKQIKPFLTNERAVLPEFDGYLYTDMSENGGSDSDDALKLADEIFHFAARSFNIPPVLLFGEVAGTADALDRWLTVGIDPLCDQLQEEINRKRYGYARWERGDYLRVDSSSIKHFDLLGNAANIEKLIGSGAFSINDVRIACGQARISEKWADQYYITKNFSTIEEGTRPAGGGE